MLFKLALLSLLGWVQIAHSAKSFTDKIKHVIVFMLENRAFDHMIGYMHEDRPEIDGCTEARGLNCTNPLNSTEKVSMRIPVGPNAEWVQPGDPSHSLQGTTWELFGSESADTNVWPPPMNGFVSAYAKEDKIEGDEGRMIMQGFNPETVPIITTLANEFLLFDRWFSDVPACTYPNRAYAYMGTSRGMDYNHKKTLFEGFPGVPNIFRLFDETIPANDSRIPWKTYFPWNKWPTTLILDYVRTRVERWRGTDDFFTDLKNGDLPVFSWIDPSFTSQNENDPVTDQHPDHDVRAGEQLLKEIYEGLRASSLWESSLLLVFYDEHGGFFDHVPPPLTVNPDGMNAGHFNFERLGLRIPAIIVSPWVGQGVMAPRPDPSSVNQYSHSSLLKTLRTIYGGGHINPYTKRDEVALSFEDLINLDSPRTDCIETLPDVPGWNGTDTSGSWKNPINDWQAAMAIAISPMCEPEGGVLKAETLVDENAGTTEKELDEWMSACMRRVLREEGMRRD